MSVLDGNLQIVFSHVPEGVTDEEGRRAASPPSTLTLLGLIRHMTDVERWWFRRVHRGEDVAAVFDDDDLRGELRGWQA